MENKLSFNSVPKWGGRLAYYLHLLKKSNDSTRLNMVMKFLTHEIITNIYTPEICIHLDWLLTSKQFDIMYAF